MTKVSSYALIGILAYANTFANAAFTDKTEIWRLAGGPENNILVAKWHRPGGGSEDVAGAALDLNLCLGNFDGKLAWAKAAASPARTRPAAILSCKCNAGPGPVDASINLDEGIELKDGKLSCGPAPDARANRRRRRNAAPLHTMRSLTSSQTATATATATITVEVSEPTAPAPAPEPAPATDLLYAGCKYIAVSASTPGKSMLEAHCPIRTPTGSHAIYARYMLDLDLCIVNNGGVAEFQHRGMGGSSCKFSNTTNSVEWAYDCGGTPGTLNIVGRFTLDRSKSVLSCFDGQQAQGQVPLDWACKDLRLSADVPGALIASCPTDLSQSEFVTTTMDLNHCLAVDPGALGMAQSTIEFWPQQYGNAFENCKYCSIWSTTLSGSPRNTLNCNCRHNANAVWPAWTTFAVVGEHISFSPVSFRPTCIAGVMSGHRMSHSDAALGLPGQWMFS
ncbi:hypothetical protein RB595_003430 [Gaeumannomyces hyphopodioides]